MDDYGLCFRGKKEALDLYQSDQDITLEEDIKHNSFDQNKDSDNRLYIGDNLHVMKNIRGYYSGSVDCIYIDPPYNTGGSSFVYKDDFRSKNDNHSGWLSFMLPRLMLAQDLLSDNGAIFISIDDNEYANLKLLCNEVFGENNYVGSFIVNNNPAGRSYDKNIRKTHEYILVYAKRKDNLMFNEIPKNIDALKSYNREDDKGRYRLVELRNRNPMFKRLNRPTMFYPFYADKYMNVSLCKDDAFNQEIYPRNSRGEDGCWTWGKNKAGESIGLLVAKKTSSGKWSVYRKDYLNDISSKTKVRSIWMDSEYSNMNGRRRLRDLFGGDTVFDFPKPVDLVKQCIFLSTSRESIVMDFFAGSGTTADAVMSLNKDDDGERKFVLIQLPEKISDYSKEYASSTSRRNGYQDISDITRNRIVKAAEYYDDSSGFKVFREI